MKATPHIERRAARIIGVVPRATLRYKSRTPLQEALRIRLRELAATHVRYGYQRLTALLRREGWHVNAIRVYRLYDQEEPKVCSVEQKKISRRHRVPQSVAAVPNRCWSADFVSDKLADGRSHRILTTVDQRVCRIGSGRSMNGTRIVAALTHAADERHRRASLWTMEASSPVGLWRSGPFATTRSFVLSTPGRPVENGFIESFNGSCGTNA